MVPAIGPLEMTLQTLDDATRSLVALAAAIAIGNESAIEEHGRTCVAHGAPETWLGELLLQSTLMVGWPRALIAAAVLRRVAGPPRALEDGGNYQDASAWQRRGVEVCRTIYGANYERLRSNIRDLHPDLEAWMVTEGYGRTIGRPGLDLARRELAIAAQVAVQGAERQLHSHLKGALHAGVSPAVLDEALAEVRPMLGAREQEVLASTRARIGAA